MEPSGQSPLPPPPGSMSWPAPTRAAPAAGTRPQSTPLGLVVALAAAGIGWLIIGFELFMVYVFVGREESCRANRGDAYQSCVRQEDVTELIAEGVAIALSMVALLIVFRSFRRRSRDGLQRAHWIAGAGAVLLAIACVVLWIHGSNGGWEPTRPLPYEPIPAFWGHATMSIGVLIGSLVGARTPLARRRLPDGMSR